MTATWSGIPTPTSADWIGLYTPGEPNSNVVIWRYTNGAASGSLPLTVPTSAAPGTYELRLFPNSTYTSIATSNSFTVTTTPTVSGTVTVGSSPLSGVTFAATNGGTCASSNASGQYSCSVPTGWSGTITPSLSGYTFSPASRSYNNLTAGQSGQDFTAAAAVATTMYFIHTDHLNTPRVITNQSAQVVWRWDNSDPFGGDVPNENPSGLGTFTCNLRLPGQYFDKETNLHYNYFRDYDPAIGRYVQADPLGITTTPRPTTTTRLNHLYGYVAGNPLRWSDPYGLTLQDIDNMLELVNLTQLDLNVPMAVDVRNLGTDIYGNPTVGFTNPITLNISISDRYLQELNCNQLQGLFETLTHESIHRTRPRWDMIRRPVNHPDIYEDASRRTREARELIRNYCRCPN